MVGTSCASSVELRAKEARSLEVFEELPISNATPSHPPEKSDETQLAPASPQPSQVFDQCGCVVERRAVLTNLLLIRRLLAIFDIMHSDPDLPPAGRQTPAKGVFPTFDGATIVWCTVCADGRGDWCAQPDVMTFLHEIWSEPDHAWLVGNFLLMPDHVHFFATPKDEHGAWVEVERWTAFWKDRFSKRCRNPAWRWQRGLFHHRLRSEQEYVEKGVYMRNNPVRAGLVKDAEEWPWKGRVHTLRW